MHTTRDAMASSRLAAWPACLWMFLVLALPCVMPAQACAARPLPAPTTRVTVSALPLAAWYDTLWSKIHNQLNNRTGAIQFGLIFMLIALWIIWWRK